MNRPPYWSNSTGGSAKLFGNTRRTRPASAKVDSRSSKNWSLQEQVTILQHELLVSKSEVQKVTEDLNCLIELIKRAWTGEKSAHIHIAKVVGMAPPDLIKDTNCRRTAIIKTRVLNHWAVLAIGLLNREYRRTEKQIEARQLYYFQQRHDYLEQQLVLYKEQINFSTPPTEEAHWLSLANTTQSDRKSFHAADHDLGDKMVPPPPSPSNDSPLHEGRRTSPTPASHMSEGTRSRFYNWQQNDVLCKYFSKTSSATGSGRKTPGKPSSEPERNLTWADLVTAPSQQRKAANKPASVTMEEPYRKPKKAVQPAKYQDVLGDELVDDTIYLPYDDPSRYASSSLFDPESALGGELSLTTRVKRPLSGKMRQADNIRARPRSAVIKQERPLKYETTRPISAPIRRLNNTTTTTKKPPGNQNKKQYVPIDKVVYARHPPHRVAAIAADVGPASEGVSLGPASESSGGNARTSKAPPKKADKQGEQFLLEKEKMLLEDPKLAELINVDVARPECIQEFVVELREMRDQENDFKERAVELQRRLGIQTTGMMYPLVR